MENVLSLIGGAILLFSGEMVIKAIPRLGVNAQWLLFIPASLTRPLAFSVLMQVLFGGIFPINETVCLSITWIVSPILFIFTASKTIPKGSRKITTVFCVLWIAGCIYEVVVRTEHYKTRIIQIIVMVLYLFWQNYTRRFMLTKEKKQHEEEEL
jgi:hypothetical protein